MAKIDDPIAQLKKGAEKDARNIPAEILVRGSAWIPHIGDKIRKAIDAIRGANADSRLEFLITAIIEQLEAHEDSIDGILSRFDEPEFTRLIAVIIERIFFLASDKKVKRFAAVLTNVALRETTEQTLEDAACFIHALDELSEDDIKVLKHLYNHQSRLVNENHAMPYNSFFPAMNDMLADARNLGLQMDDFFARCSRLTGYGLAIELSNRHGTMGNPDDFAFRLTLLGKRLIGMLIAAGEEMQVTRRR